MKEKLIRANRDAQKYKVNPSLKKKNTKLKIKI